MRLLLIGCTGFIGSELVPRLLSDGHQLTLVSRKNQHIFLPKTSSAQLIRLRLNPAEPENWQIDSLRNALTEAEGVINLAGEPIAEKRWTSNHCLKLQNSRIATTKSLINTINDFKNLTLTLDIKSEKIYANSKDKKENRIDIETKYTEK